ncbi:MAG: rplX [Chlamydiales bacterium]|jgi:large subunit ribosomal protein L24|nr:rplX [Chlamydiales bacterium]
MSKKIREGDLVMVLSGNEKGKTGVVKSCSEDTAIVQGLNMRTSYIKKNKDYPNGKLLRTEAPIRLCKLRTCNADGKPVKLHARFNDQGEKELYYMENGQAVFYRNVKKSK